MRYLEDFFGYFILGLLILIGLACFIAPLVITIVLVVAYSHWFWFLLFAYLITVPIGMVIFDEIF